MNNYGFFIIDNEGHHFLRLHQYYMNLRDAEKYVIKRLKHFDIQRPKGGWRNNHFVLSSQTAPEVQLGKFDSLVKEARLKGYVLALDRLIDLEDSIFGGTMNMSSSSERFIITPIFSDSSVEVTEFDGPSRFYSIEDELTNDIIYFRKQCCECSVEHTFEKTARFYRSYLFASISIIEAFVNRYVLVLNKTDDTFKRHWKNDFRMKNRIEFLYKFLTGNEFSKLNSTKEWNHFMKLKDLRNSIIHSSSPYLGIQIKKIATHLNYANFGVGGLMRTIREEQKQSTMAFMNRLIKLPKIEYSKD